MTKTKALKQSIDKWMQDEQTKIFEKYGVGFAFSKEQINTYISEQRANGYEGKFVHLMLGMYCRKDTAEVMMKEIAELHKEHSSRLKNLFALDKSIEIKMVDYEAYYTGEYHDESLVLSVRQVFPEAKYEDFERVYKKTIHKH